MCPTNDNLQNRVSQFFTSPAYGVVGASNNRDKFGNKVLRLYQHKNLKVYPVNPNEKVIEGVSSVDHITDLPAEVKSISIITPPPITEQIVKQAIAHGIKNIWMQPGAESEAAITECENNNINVIAGGPCILVIMGSR